MASKERARWITQQAVYKGRLIKTSCIKCGRQAEAHHEDYSKPLKVMWLCRHHHVELHNFKRDPDYFKTERPGSFSTVIRVSLRGRFFAEAHKGKLINDLLEQHYEESHGRTSATSP